MDDHRNVWIIDFSVGCLPSSSPSSISHLPLQHTGPGHVLKDVSKLESDTLYCFTPLDNEADLAEGMLITQLLINIRCA